MNTFLVVTASSLPYKVKDPTLLSNMEREPYREKQYVLTWETIEGTIFWEYNAI
jgi:hypothetical protein